MSMVDVNEIILSERALREGLVVDWMCRNNYLKDQLSFQGSIRERTVIHQAKRFGVNSKRSKRVSEFALTFYDKTQGILHDDKGCLLYTSPSPRDRQKSRMPSSA